MRRGAPPRARAHAGTCTGNQARRALGWAGRFWEWVAIGGDGGVGVGGNG